MSNFHIKLWPLKFNCKYVYANFKSLHEFVVVVIFLFATVVSSTGCVTIMNMKNPINPIVVKVRIPPRIVLKFVAPLCDKATLDPNMSIERILFEIILNETYQYNKIFIELKY